MKNVTKTGMMKQEKIKEIKKKFSDIFSKKKKKRKKNQSSLKFCK